MRSQIQTDTEPENYSHNNEIDEDEEEDSEIEEDSGDTDNEDSDDPETAIVTVVQGEPLWTGKELEIVAQLKDQWFLGTDEQRRAVLDKGVAAIVQIAPQDNVKLKKKLRKWLKRRAGKRDGYGPGKRPTLLTVISYYKEAEVTKIVENKHGVKPGNKKRFLGLWRQEISQLLNDLRTNSARKAELKAIEGLRDDWMKKGPPRERRKKRAEKEINRRVMEFSGEMYFEYGARVVVLAGYRNTENEACTAIFDYNKNIGRSKESFVAGRPKETQVYKPAWDRYILNNLTDDEGEEGNGGGHTETTVECRQVSMKKPDISFQLNSRGEPILPSDCLQGKLDEKKHVIRCFIRAHYARAQGLSYPGPGGTPPWSKMMESPDAFFDNDLLPDGVAFKDPSRLVTGPIEKILKHWLTAEKTGKPAFHFHHYWSEAGKEYKEAIVIEESGETASGDELGKGKADKTKKKKAKARKQKEGEKGQEGETKRGRKGRKKTKGNARTSNKEVDDDMSDDGEVKRDEKGGNKTETKAGTGGLAGRKEGRVEKSPVEGEDNGHSSEAGTHMERGRGEQSKSEQQTPHPPQPDDCEQGGSNIWNSDDMGWTFASRMHEGGVGGNSLVPVGARADLQKEKSSGSSMLKNTHPIDPLLRPGFPTQGPNDPVPTGYNPIPHMFVPQTMMQQNPNTSNAPTPQTSQTPGELIKENTLVQMAQQIEVMKRAMAASGLHIPPIPGLSSLSVTGGKDCDRGESPGEIIDDEVKTRPRTWPDDATPLKTRRQAKAGKPVRHGEKSTASGSSKRKGENGSTDEGQPPAKKAKKGQATAVRKAAKEVPKPRLLTKGKGRDDDDDPFNLRKSRRMKRGL